MTGKPRGGGRGDGDGGSPGNGGGRGDGEGGSPQRRRGDSGGVPSNISGGQDRIAEQGRLGRRGGGGSRPEGGTGGDRGRRGFPVAEDVPGPARGKTLNLPNSRHNVSGAGSGEIKDPSTVYLRGYEHVARDDVAEIAAGNARWDSDRQRYEVNGRYYGVEATGTVFPDSGTGVVKLDRNEYAALKEIVKAGGDLSLSPQLTRAPRFVNNPEAVAKAKAIYDGTYQP